MSSFSERYNNWKNNNKKSQTSISSSFNDRYNKWKEEQEKKRNIEDTRTQSIEKLATAREDRRKAIIQSKNEALQIASKRDEKVQEKQQEKKQNKYVSNGPITETNKTKMQEDMNKLPTAKDKVSLAKPSELVYLEKITNSDVKARENAIKVNKAIKDKNYVSTLGFVLNGITEGMNKGTAGIANAGLMLASYNLNKASKTTDKAYNLSKKILEKYGKANSEEGQALLNKVGNARDWMSNSKNKILDKAEDFDDRTSIYDKTLNRVDNKIMKTGGQVTSTVGQMIPAIVANLAVPGSGVVASAVSSGGSSAMETLNDDRSNLGQSVATGTAKGIVSAVVEKLVGGDYISKNGGFDKYVAKGIKNKVSNNVAQKALYKGYQVLGENAEEQLENEAGYLIDKIINNKDMPNLKQRWEDLSETAKVTTLSTLVLNSVGLGGGSIDDVDLSSFNDKDKKAIQEIVTTMEDGQVGIKEIVKNQVPAQQELVQNNNLSQNIPENMQNEYYSSATKSNIDINNKTINDIYNVTNKRGIKASYNADLFTNNNHDAIWRINKNDKGDITREVILNPNSTNTNKTLQNIIVHELTHDMEGQKIDYEQLRKFALSKMKTQEGYDSAIENLKDAYSSVYDRNSADFDTLVQQEAVADFLGENLGNQEFVNELVKSQNRNWVQKFYNWVSNKVQSFGNKITGNTEAEYWRKVKYIFEKALNSEYQGNNAQSKFSINSNFKTDYNNWNKVDRSGNFLIGRTSQALQSIGLNDSDIVMDKSKILRIKNDHPEMNDDIIKSIPDILENPTLILNTQSKEKKAKGRKIVFGEVTDTKGNPVLVALELNPVENKTNIDKIYKVASAYGKENLNAIQNWLNSKENILYIDEQKNRTTNWLNGLGLQLPVPYNTYSSISSIAPLNEDVNTTKYSMQENENNAQNTKGKWNKFLKSNSINKGTGETMQDVKLAPQNNNIAPSKANNKLPVGKFTKEQNKLLIENMPKPNITKVNTETKKTNTQILTSVRKTKANIKETLDMANQKIVNHRHYIDKLAKKKGNDTLKFITDRMNKSYSEANYQIGKKQTDLKGNVVGESLVDIFEPIEKAKLKDVFQNYLAHKHNINRMQQDKAIFGSEITALDSKKIVLEMEREHPEFKNIADKVYKYLDNNTKLLEEAGTVEKGMKDYLKNLYPYYVPIFRANDKTILNTQKEGIRTNSVIKKATGGNADILPIEDAIALQTIQARKAIRFNETAKEIAKTLKLEAKEENSRFGNGTLVEPQEIFTEIFDMDNNLKVNDKGVAELTYYDNGKAKTIEISNEIYKSLKPMLMSDLENTKPIQIWQKIVKGRKDLLTTYSPLFTYYRNPVKDIGEAIFNSKNFMRLIKNYPTSYADMFKNNDIWQLYESMGGAGTSYYNYDIGIKNTGKANQFKEKVTSIAEAIEQAPRYSEFKSTLEKYGVIERGKLNKDKLTQKILSEALYNASEVTTNFSRGGEWTKKADRNGFTFLNAGVQGLSKFYRNLTGQNGFKGYLSITTKAVLTGIAPALINHLLLDDDDEYEDLPDYVKDNYFLFKKDDGTFVRIAKGRVVGTIGAFARRTYDAVIKKKGISAYKGFLKTASDNIAPNNPLDNNVLSPIIQASKNKSWYGEDIVPQRLQKQLPKNQYDETTDKISIWLGQRTGISPKTINYLIDQYSGGIGDISLPYITPQARNNPVEKEFTVNSIEKNKNVSNFYDTLDKQTQLANDIEPLDENVVKSMYLSNVNSKMSDLYKEKRIIQMSDISNESKKKKVLEMQNDINNLAKGALNKYNNVKLGNNYATIDKKDYYKNSENEWKTLTETEEEKNKDITIKTYADYKLKVEKETKKQREQEELTKEKNLKDKDKIQILIDSNYSNKEKTSLYENYILSSTDKNYPIIKESGININEYLRYKSQEFSADKKDDGTIDGISISGSKKKKVWNYINDMNITGIQKILLYGMEYTPNDEQQNLLFNYIKALPNKTKKEKMEILSHFKGYTIYEDGRVEY